MHSKNDIELLSLNNNNCNLQTQVNKEPLKHLLKEYNDAIEYFTKNNFSSSLDEARKKAQMINNALKRIKKGEEFETFDLPGTVTPEFIYGMSYEERQKKFNEMVKYYIKRKEEMKSTMENNINDYLSLSKKEQKKNIESIKKNNEYFKGEIQNCNNNIKKLKQLEENQWTPFPLFMKTEKEEEVEDINSEIPNNCLLIQLTLLSSNIDFHSINIIIPDLCNELISTKKCGIIYENQFQLESSSYKVLPKKFLIVKLFKSSCCRSILLNKQQYQLTYLFEHRSLRITESKYINSKK